MSDLLASEGSGRYPHHFAKLLAEVTVTVESALQRNIDNGVITVLQKVFSAF
jgi:hypothetical protein